MYSTCTFCYAPLGANEALEHFPVGRRVAFDATRGRLWAVCSVCAQWNLSPIETRWEAIEEGERLYRDARLRAATDQIGLARVADGTELIRIGEPLRPEFAAWRYGDRFARRWRVRGRAAAAWAGAGVLVQGWAFITVGPVAALPVWAYIAANATSRLLARATISANLARADGQRARVTQYHVNQMVIRRDASLAEGWRLEVPYAPVERRSTFARAADPVLTLHGDAARRAAAQMLPRLNRGGGARATVSDAVAVLNRHGDPDAVMRFAGQFVNRVGKTDWSDPEQVSVDAVRRSGLGPLALAPDAVRLAAEMAVHEESERLALHGALADLEAQWKDAEEIAAIADGLTTSPSVLKAMERLRFR